MVILGYIFLFLHKNKCCGYILVPRQGTSNDYSQHVFFFCFFFLNGELEKIIKNSSFKTSPLLNYNYLDLTIR